MPAKIQQQFSPILVTKSYLPPKERYLEYISSIWDSHVLTNNGALTRTLTENLEKYLKVENLVLLSNGTLALQLVIKALKLQGEILTTPYSYVATTNSILWEGCIPKFVDIDPNTFCIDPNQIEKNITKNTQAILATHVYGYPCDTAAIKQIANKYNLKVIYDAAHAFGVKVNGRSLLLEGDCSTLSFHATKLFHTVEGGAVIANTQELLESVSLLSKFGHLGEDRYLDIGINAKLSEVHAAMGLAILPDVGSLICKRRELSEMYDMLLDGLNLQKPAHKSGVDYNYAYYPVVFKSHHEMLGVRKILETNDIFARRYFYPSLNTLPFLPSESLEACPISESIADRVLCLPLYPDLEGASIKKITSVIKKYIS